MAIVIFMVFREPFISGIVVISALADIMTAAASMDNLRCEALPGNSGRSPDAHRLFSRYGYSPLHEGTSKKGVVEEKIMGAMGTGLTMTGPPLVAQSGAYPRLRLLYMIIPSFTRMDVIADIDCGPHIRPAADHLQHLDNQCSGPEMVHQPVKKAQGGEEMRINRNGPEDRNLLVAVFVALALIAPLPIGQGDPSSQGSSTAWISRADPGSSSSCKAQ